MDRLTHVRTGANLITGYWTNHKKQELVDALGRYEDTGLSADETAELAEVCSNQRKKMDSLTECIEDIRKKYLLKAKQFTDLPEAFEAYAAEYIEDHKIAVNSTSKLDTIRSKAAASVAEDFQIWLTNKMIEYLKEDDA